MEKAQIVRYALMQTAALVYAVLASATAMKCARHGADIRTVRLIDMPAWYHWASFLTDYGFLFLIIVVIWTGGVAYLSSPFTRLEIGEAPLTWSGTAVVLLISLVGATATCFAVVCASPALWVH